MRGPTEPLKKTKKTMEDYGEEVALHQLLKGVYRNQTGSLEKEVTLPFRAKPRVKVSSGLPSGLVAIAACVTLAALFYWTLFKGNQSIEGNMLAYVSSISGPVSVVGDDGLFKSLELGEELESGVKIVTSSSSMLEVTYKDGTKLQLEENVELLSHFSLNQAKSIELKKGKVSLDVVPQTISQPLTVVTAFAQATVLGTRLTMELKDHYTEMEVTEGAVEFQREKDSRALIVREGFIAELGENRKSLQINDEEDPSIQGFSLVSVETGEIIQGYESLQSNQNIRISDLPRGGVNIKMNTTGRMREVRIVSNRHPIFSRESSAPYSLAGDEIQYGGGYRKMHIKEGEYKYNISFVNLENKESEVVDLTIHFMD